MIRRHDSAISTYHCLQKSHSGKSSSTCNLPLPPWVLASALARAQTASRRTAEGSSSPKASVQRGFRETGQRVLLESIGSQGTGRFWGKAQFWIEDFGTDEWTLSSLFSSPCLAANGRGLMILWAWFIHHLLGGWWPALLEKHLVEEDYLHCWPGGHKNKI